MECAPGPFEARHGNPHSSRAGSRTDTGSGSLLTVLAELPGPDGDPIRIRSSTADDAPAVLAYLRRVGAESDFLSFGGEGPPISEAEERVFLARVGTTDNALAIIAEWRGEIVGYLTFTGGNRPRTRHAGEFGITVVQACQASDSAAD